MVLCPPVGVFDPILGPGLLGLAIACTLLNLAGVFLLTFRSIPQRINRRLIAMEEDVRKMRADAERWTSTVGGLIDQNEASFERAESKRKSAAATASRALRVGMTEAEPASRAEVIAKLRRDNRAA